MNTEYKLYTLRDHSELNSAAAEWFNQRWGVPVEAYLESMELCQRERDSFTQWYVIKHGDRIIAGMGVIENDFHERKDLAPSICAVFTEEEYRGQGLSKHLLDYICADLSRLGYNTVYLLTSHTEFYEKCGFEHFCDVKEDGGDIARVYRRSSACGDSMAAIKGFLDGEGRLTAIPAKRKMKLHCFIYLSEKFIKGKVYSEREVNALLNEWHTYGDPVTLRRELCDHKILLRDDYGKEYFLSDSLPTFETLEKMYC